MIWDRSYTIWGVGDNRITVIKNRLFGFMDGDGKEVIPPQYENAFHFSEGRAAVKKNGKYGFINITGRVVIPFQFNDGGVFYDDRAVLEGNDKCGVIDTTGNIVVPMEYYRIHHYSEGLAAATKRGGLYGYLDKSGNVAIPFQYWDPSTFNSGVLRRYPFYIMPDHPPHNFEFIDHTGAPVAALNALRNSIDDISGFSEGLAVAKKGGKYGMIDLNGQTVIPFQYDELEPCINGIIVSHIKPSSNSLPSGSRILDKTGKIVFTSDADVLFRLGKSNYFFSRTGRTVYSVTP